MLKITDEEHCNSRAVEKENTIFLMLKLRKGKKKIKFINILAILLMLKSSTQNFYYRG